MKKCDFLVLGAGVSGLSASYHLGHERCTIIERAKRAFGHCKSRQVEGLMWDEGPHVSFTKNEYVRELIAKSVEGKYVEFPAVIGNYYQGAWVNHPAQLNLLQVPEPLRSECVSSFVEAYSERDGKYASDYGQWLRMAFGEVFAKNFPYPYTKKYWTCRPEELETSWVGERVYRPDKDDVIKGSESLPVVNKNYISKVRYPKSGGFEAYFKQLASDARIDFDKEVLEIDLENKLVRCADGSLYRYNRLVSTLPLPVFIRACKGVTDKVLSAAAALNCTSGILVNVSVPHQTLRSEHWLYVYDEDKLSTRITFVEKLDGGALEKNHSGIQVEVYTNLNNDLKQDDSFVRKKVVNELYEMGLIQSDVDSDSLHSFVTHFKWGNVIFDHARRNSLDIIYEWLSDKGLVRELDEMHPSSESWEKTPSIQSATLVFAGRYGQWKYLWSDDCILRGRQIGEVWSES